MIWRALVAGTVLLAPVALWATDIDEVQFSALDQPTINVSLKLSANGDPLADTSGMANFAINAFLDTGASGILLSDTTASTHGIDRQMLLSGNYAAFSDIGAVERAQFQISQPLYLGLAPNHADAGALVDDPTDLSLYTHTIGPVRTQVGLPSLDPFAMEMDVVGMPAMKGKVTVLDPRPVNNLIDDFTNGDIDGLLRDNIRSYIYAPGTAYDATKANEWERGIPVTNRHVKLSLADFNDYTTTDAGAQPPTLVASPFIGPNPRKKIDPSIVDNTPPITLHLGAYSKDGTFLLDTGAGFSVISSEMAGSLHVKYQTGTQGTDNPILVYTTDGITDGAPVENQFQKDVAGVTGQAKVAGFYLDSLLVRTMEGNPADENDPNHIRYLNTSVLVADILLQDPDPTDGQNLPTMTLDGIFGMNFLSTSGEYGITVGDDGSINVTFDAWRESPMNWVVFDEPNGILGLDLVGVEAVPEPAGLSMLLLGVLFLRRRRAA